MRPELSVRLRAHKLSNRAHKTHSWVHYQSPSLYQSQNRGQNQDLLMTPPIRAKTARTRASLRKSVPNPKRKPLTREGSTLLKTADDLR